MQRYYISTIHRLDDVFDNLDNIIAGSKRTERIVDAINQRERARAESEKKSKATKTMTSTKSKRGGSNEKTTATRKYSKGSIGSSDSHGKQSTVRQRENINNG